MINIAFRLLLTFNATSLLVILFLVQQRYALAYFFPEIQYISQWPNALSYLLYILLPVLFTGLSLVLCRYLGQDEFKTGETVSIEYANNRFLPSYLGYFFVALSIQHWETLWFVYGVLFIFTFFSQALYFNPLFLLFGYTFYTIKTQSGTVIFLISRYRYKKPDDVEIKTAYRINNYTFIE